MYDWTEITSEVSELGDYILGENLLTINPSPRKRRRQAFQMIIDLQK